MSTTKEISRLATAVLAHTPRITFSELISADDARGLVSSRLRGLFNGLERACGEVARQCEGKNQDEIRSILQREFGAVMSREMQPVKTQAL